MIVCVCSGGSSRCLKLVWAVQLKKKIFMRLKIACEVIEILKHSPSYGNWNWRKNHPAFYGSFLNCTELRYSHLGYCFRWLKHLEGNEWFLDFFKNLSAFVTVHKVLTKGTLFSRSFIVFSYFLIDFFTFFPDFCPFFLKFIVTELNLMDIFLKHYLNMLTFRWTWYNTRKKQGKWTNNKKNEA